MLIAIGGYATAGKDAFADSLAEIGFAKTFMAKPLERALLTLDPWIQTSTHTYQRYSSLHAAHGYDGTKQFLEVREMLQRLGTEFGRNQIADDVWVKAMEKDLDVLTAIGHEDIVVTGVRYPNELNMLRKRGCLAVWVTRPGVEAVNGHSSDNTLSVLDFDVEVMNDSSVEDLGKKARAIVAAGIV